MRVRGLIAQELVASGLTSMVGVGVGVGVSVTFPSVTYLNLLLLRSSSHLQPVEMGENKDTRANPGGERYCRALASKSAS